MSAEKILPFLGGFIGLVLDLYRSLGATADDLTIISNRAGEIARRIRADIAADRAKEQAQAGVEQ